MEKHILPVMRLALVLAFSLCAFANSTFAYTTNVGLSRLVEDKSGIMMECGLPLASIPPSGFFPVHFRISNTTSDTHTWRVSFQGGGGGLMGQLSMSYSSYLTVGAGQSREWDLLVPRPGLDTREPSYGMMRGTISGYGIKGGGEFHIPSHYSGGLRNSVYTVMSESLATAAWSKISGELKSATPPTPPTGDEWFTSRRFARASRSGGRELSGSQVSLKELPADWRALAGVSAFWLSRTDWEGLSSDRKRAFRQWIMAGGHLFVASTEDTIAQLTLLPASFEVGKEVPIGFGWVKAVKFVSGELSPPATAQEILVLDSAVVPIWQEDYENEWAFEEFVGWPKLNVQLIIGFVALFAIVIGPMNLRWFAPPQRRARLFFTIPLISIAASAALLGAIAVSDGVGGTGGRNVILYMPAKENQVTVLQEQIARTRLLFARGFKISENVQVSFSAQNRQSDRGLSFAREGDGVSGDWFRSRTVQTHVLRTNTPSRAEVVLQSGGVGDVPPVLLSSASVPLKDLYYVDAGGRYWYAEKLETGRPITLKPTTGSAFDRWVAGVSQDLSLNFKSTVRQVGKRPGHFYAMAEPMPEGPIETLSSIRWTKQNVFCFGTCTGAESK